MDFSSIAWLLYGHLLLFSLSLTSRRESNYYVAYNMCNLYCNYKR